MHNRRAIEDLVEGRHGRPFSLLGVHKGKDDAHLWLRVFLPGAKSASVLQEKEKLPLSQENPAGLFEARLPPSFDPEMPYRVAARYSDDRAEEFHDPYAFRQLLSEYDLHLLGEGNHFRSYEKLGAHLETRQKIPGVRFAVWAPNAQSLAVMGDFNGWSRRRHPMELHPGTGIWQLFIPGLEAGARYKYAVHLRSGEVLDKIDPYGFFFEEPPKTAGIVFELSNYRWQDEKWMAERAEMNGLRAPISVYEVHLGSWKRSNSKQPQPLSYRELADQLVSYVVEMGFTHIELLPISEHPFSGSWGYQGTGYFAPTSRFGTPDEFRYLVDRCHQSGIGVLLDWVPGHFPRDLHALAMFDGSRLYEHADPRQGAHPDWGTLIFNLGRNEVRNFLLSSALFWLDQYHLDGLRVDAVASMLYLDYSREEGEWLPNKHGGKENLEAIDFLRRFNELVYEYHPGTMTIAEESTAWPSVSRPTYLGGLGFTFKWNMGWMHDSLDYISKDPIHRKFHHEKLTFSMLYAFSENYVLPLSHDEVVHGKGSLIDKLPGDVWQKFANLRLYMAYLFGHPGKKLLFMGAEFGQWREWDSEGSLDWHLLNWELHRQVQSFVRELNTLYRREPSMHEVDFNWKGFEWIDFHDQDHSVISFERRAAESADYLIFVFNFTPRPRSNYRIGVPEKTIYRELLNSDAQHWGGSNLGNLGGVEAEEIPKHGREYSIDLTLPPLGALVLKPKTEDSETESRA